MLDLQLLLDIVGSVFIYIQNHQPLGADLGDLAAQLRADGSAAAGKQHGLPPVIGLGILAEDLRSLTEQQFLRVKVPQASLAVDRLGGGIVIGFQLAAGLLVVGIEFLFPLGGSPGNGKDDFLDIVVPKGFGIGLLLGKHRHAVDAAADLIPVDIHKESGGIGRVRIAGQVRCQTCPHPARADDGNVDPPVPLGLVLRLHLDTGQLLGHHPQKVRCLRASAVGVI